ncbi:aminotransferase class I/II-fold pyridoxal phosphate-dependent enzyme [Cellulomonas sp. RIT-PI-Y]|uniref:MalY/PatB family protein n=1 Tax=Cellulomonas sp. RIT-PI-Y TaxID=3035297 RepID=UPI0021D90B90|nr:aminotransferase class I/II-fold pyridoxal phosphate-dependent enzyme [Cellulomonas sp. RIT-PI-Y]
MTFTDDADARTADQLRAAGSLKWSQFPDRIGAFVAEADFGTAPAVSAALHAAVDAGRLGYQSPADVDRMAHAFAGFAEAHHGWTVPVDRVRPLPDVFTAFRAAIEQFTSPGAAVILPTPAYMPFLTLPGSLGRRVIEVPLVEVDGRMTHDLAGIGRALDDGGELLLLCNPHNPTGRVLDADELSGIAAVVDAHGGRVFADEIHAPLVYPGRAHLPYAALSPVTAGHAFTATSASKAWNIPGLKAAQLVLSNDADAERWATIGEEYEKGASTLGLIAAAAAYTDGRDWLAEAVHYLDGNRRLFAELVADRLPTVGFTPPEGTYLGWLDLRDVGLGDRPARAIPGVALTDGLACGAAGAGFARVTLATPRPVLRAIVDHLAATIA